MNSFLVLFYILDQCYTLCHEDDLGGFLGAISPELWNDGKPMDMAIYNDWKAQNEGVLFDKDNALDQIMAFLTRYEKQFGFDFSETKKTLKNDISRKQIENAINSARSVK